MYTELIKRLESAEEARRDLDSLIAGALDMPVPNDPASWPPRFTASLDSAVTLVPEGWFWRVGQTSQFQAWAGVYEMHPDHTESGRNEFSWYREWRESKSTPAIALCIASLRAREAQE